MAAGDDRRVALITGITGQVSILFFTEFNFQVISMLSQNMLT